MLAKSSFHFFERDSKIIEDSTTRVVVLKCSQDTKLERATRGRNEIVSNRSQVSRN